MEKIFIDFDADELCGEFQYDGFDVLVESSGGKATDRFIIYLLDRDSSELVLVNWSYGYTNLLKTETVDQSTINCIDRFLSENPDPFKNLDA